VPKALASMPEDSRPDVLHQSGAKHFDAVQAAYRKAGVKADILPFLDDMAYFYSQADVVLCRAGALTVAELAAAGLASILIPFPFAVDDHQTSNARFLSEHGAGILLPQDQMSPGKLAQILGGMTRERALEMAIAARRLARPDAAKRVAEACAEVATKRTEIRKK
jgi:UDP-N-acetylglucosamine--N-acetylmuramyl-(pentapeptide) pyrophosphoryl-undecaprenol N-acetylglucosamine transferase